jgi:hypothetical protein
MLENISKLKYNRAYEAIDKQAVIIGAARQGSAVKARKHLLRSILY